MQPDRIEEAVSEVVRAVVRAVRSDDAARRALRELLAHFASETDPPRERTEETLPEAPAAAEPARPPAAQAPPPVMKSAHLQLKLGGQDIAIPVTDTPEAIDAAQRAGQPAAGFKGPAVVREERDEPPPDIRPVTDRARLKAEACRWAAERRRRIADGADFQTAIRPTDNDLSNRARAIRDCFLWPLDPYAEIPDDATLNTIAACYENLSDMAEAVLSCTADEEGLRYLRDTLYLMAETQSALRAALLRAGRGNDDEQMTAFRWLKATTFREQIFVDRYMRLDDPADPDNWSDLSERIDALAEKIAADRRTAQELRKHWSKARYASEKLAAAPDNPAYHWSTLDACVARLCELGVRHSDTRLRDLLLPAIETLPEDFQTGEHLERALAFLDQYLTERELQRQEEPADRREPSPALREAAELLRGSRAVIIGGICRPRSREALERDLGLSELCWISTREHQSIAPFEHEIARPETRLVLLAIRWSGHAFEGVKDFCTRHGKAYVRLPGGYNSNQVAHQILAQAGDTLRAAAR